MDETTVPPSGPFCKENNKVGMARGHGIKFNLRQVFKVRSMVKSYRRLTLLVFLFLFLFFNGCGSTEDGKGGAIAPSTPSNVTASAGSGQITLIWDDSNEAMYNNIYFLTYPGVTTSNSKQITNAISGEPITGLANETTYNFVVTAVNDAGESPASAEVSATPMPPLSGIPDNVTISGGVASATISWRWVPDAISYNVYYGRSPGVTTLSELSVKGIYLTSQTIEDLNVAPGRYYFIVTAENPSAESAPSVEMVATAKSGYKSVAAGLGHSAALRIIENTVSLGIGSVWGWGDNSSGQLGTDGIPLESHTAIEEIGVNSVTQIAAGWHHTVALRTDASVWNWGLNDYGQLGNLGTTNAELGVQASGLTDVIAIASSEKHSIVLRNDGTVWTWGFNQQGQLGYPSINCQVPFPLNQPRGWSCSFQPTEVPGITGIVTDIGAGFYHSLALTNDGVVWSWGQNDSGQLGDIPPNCPAELQISGDVGAHNHPAFTCSPFPVRVGGIAGTATATTGGWGHSLALFDDGTVWAWGKNDYGQLGYNADDFPDDPDNLTCVQTSAFTFPCRIKPIMVPGLTNIVAISAGWDHNIALNIDGTVWTWGRNDQGQLGNGENNLVPNGAPVQISDLEGITSIAAGGYHSVVLKNDGTVWAWGFNGHGQLGDDSLTDRSTPVQVLGLPDPVVVVPGI